MISYSNEAHERAMTRPIGPLPITLECPEPAPRLLKRLGLVALLIAAVVAAAYYFGWPRLVAALAF